MNRNKSLFLIILVLVVGCFCLMLRCWQHSESGNEGYYSNEESEYVQQMTETTQIRTHLSDAEMSSSQEEDVTDSPKNTEDAEGQKASNEKPKLESNEITEAVTEPENNDFVPAKMYIPGLQVDLRYATDRNFTGRKIYDFSEVYLRYGTVKKLILVQEELAGYGMSLEIWDGFRPVEAQFVLWEACPDPAYVANPYRKYSAHSSGGCVDVTLVCLDGSIVPMPTDFDDFTNKADRDYSDCGQEESENARLLERLMTDHGFKGYQQEWWHFTDLDDYPIDKHFVPEE